MFLYHTFYREVMLSASHLDTLLLWRYCIGENQWSFEVVSGYVAMMLVKIIDTRVVYCTGYPCICEVRYVSVYIGVLPRVLPWLMSRAQLKFFVNLLCKFFNLFDFWFLFFHRFLLFWEMGWAAIAGSDFSLKNCDARCLYIILPLYLFSSLFLIW